MTTLVPYLLLACLAEPFPLPDNLSTIEPLLQTAPDARELLQRHGFVVLPRGTTDLVAAFPSHGSYPVLVTSDVMLQLWFEAHRVTCEEVEKECLYPSLRELIAELLATRPPILSGPLLAAWRLNERDLYVAAALAGLDLAPPAEIAEEVRGLVDAVRSASWQGCWPSDDYTQYAPRGPYATDPVLADYFRVAKWLGRRYLPLDGTAGSPSTLRQAAAMVVRLWANPRAAALWDRIAAARVLLAGEFNQLTPPEVERALVAVLGEDWRLGDLADTDECERVLAELRRGGYPDSDVRHRLAPAEDGSWPTRSMALLPEHRLPDAALFQQFLEQGEPPSGLAVAAALGDPRAVETLRPNAAAEARLKATEAAWQAVEEPPITLAWLNLLRSLRPDADDAPAFMRTSGWADKRLNTALASWAHLRHNNLLYSVQPISRIRIEALSDGDSPASGYVEPNPVFWRAYAELCRDLRRRLAALEMLPPTPRQLLLKLADTADRFADYATLELAGKPLPESAHELIEFGEFIARFPHGETRLIADIATLGGTVRHIGTGAFHPLIVLFETAEGTTAAVGAVSSYYEFDHAERFTDERWRELLEATYAVPEPPAWTRSYRAAAGAIDPAVRARLRAAEEALLAGEREQGETLARAVAAEMRGTELEVEAQLLIARDALRRDEPERAQRALLPCLRMLGCPAYDEAMRLLRDLTGETRREAWTSAAAERLRSALAATAPRPGLSAVEDRRRQDLRAKLYLASYLHWAIDPAGLSRAIAECADSELLPALRWLAAYRGATNGTGRSFQAATFMALAEEYPASQLGEAAAAFAFLLLAEQDPAAALAVVEPMLSREPGPESEPEAVAALRELGMDGEIAPLAQEVAKPTFDIALQAGRDGRWDLWSQALRVLRLASEQDEDEWTRDDLAFLEWFESHREASAPQLQLWLNFEGTAAQVAAAALADRYPTHPLAPWALYRLSDTPEPEFQDGLIRNYPGHPATLLVRGKLAEQTGDYDEAFRLYRVAGQSEALTPPDMADAALVAGEWLSEKLERADALLAIFADYAALAGGDNPRHWILSQSVRKDDFLEAAGDPAPSQR